MPICFRGESSIYSMLLNVFEAGHASSVGLAYRLVSRRLRFRASRRAHSHPAGDVTRISVMPRKVTVKIGDAENWCRGCRDKNR